MFRADGGRVDAGQAYNATDGGQDLFIPNRNGQIVPIMPGTQGSDGGYGGPSTLAIDVSGARGNQEIMTMVQAGVAAGMQQTEGRINRNINGIVRTGRQRYR